MGFNHKLNKIAADFTSKTGSRTRVRIPVAGTRHIGIQPGQKVTVSGFRKITITKGAKPGNNVYTVEKDGAIRIPADKYGLRDVGIEIACDRLTNSVLVA
jgi:hypothetical protein